MVDEMIIEPNNGFRERETEICLRDLDDSDTYAALGKHFSSQE